MAEDAELGQIGSNDLISADYSGLDSSEISPICNVIERDQHFFTPLLSTLELPCLSVIKASPSTVGSSTSQNIIPISINTATIKSKATYLPQRPSSYNLACLDPEYIDTYPSLSQPIFDGIIRDQDFMGESGETS
ncbi:unnamed protein product, partial [Protopolystoma xenopodis]